MDVTTHVPWAVWRRLKRAIALSCDHDHNEQLRQWILEMQYL